ncbi:MAG: hypothetical protein ACFE85_17750 [Candidatus Hodarchaeota archaeon]
MLKKKINYFQFVAHIILLLFQLLFWNFIIDDAFITFRYAKNLYENNQIVFNIDESPVEGYSNFSWVLWITISFLFKIEPIIFSKISGILFCHFTIPILYKLADLLNNKKRVCNYIIIFYVLTPNVALWSVGGLETSLFCLILIISIYFFIKGIKLRTDHFIEISAIFFGLLSITRHEGAVIYAITWAYYVFIKIKDRNKILLKRFIDMLIFLAVFLMIYLPYFIWRIMYYNSFLPHTFIAKQANFNLVVLFERFLFYIPLIVFLTPILIIIIANIIKNRNLFIRDQLRFYLIILIFVLSIVLMLITSWMPGFRLAIPIITLIYLLLPKSINFLEIFNEKIRNDKDLFKKIKFFSIGLIGISNCLLIFTFYPFVNYYGIGIKECNITLGKWINENSSENSTLAVWDAGTIPFYADIKTVDIYPESLQDLHIFNNPEDVDYIFGLNITFLILNDEYFDYIKNDIRFSTNYHLIFYAQFFYASRIYRFDYIYQIYLNNGYYISNVSINALIDSSSRFYK